jgi:hypothetical protein
MQLKNLIKATLPHSITNNTVSNDIIDILLDYIENNNYMSFDITEIYQNHNQNVTKELIKVYLENLFTGFQRAIVDENIVKVLLENFSFSGNTTTENQRIIFNTAADIAQELSTQNNILVQLEQDTNTINVNEVTDILASLSSHLVSENYDFINSVITVVKSFDMNYFNSLEAFLNEEYLYTSKAFKQKKGTRAAIRYAYNIFRQSGIQVDGFAGTNDKSYVLTDSNSFSLTYSNNIYGVTKLNVPASYSKISFFTGTNVIKIPSDIKLIANKSYTNISTNNVITTSTIFFGYRTNSSINLGEIIGSDVSIVDIDRGVSGSIVGKYIENNILNTITIVIDGSNSNILDTSFKYLVEGSLYPEIYENAIKPIVHPVGYDYIYSRIIVLYLNDRLSNSISYINTNIVVNCNNGGSTVSYNDKTILNVKEEYNNFNQLKQTILFSDYTYIIRDYNTIVSYYNADTSLNTEYSPACALLFTYTASMNSGITEQFTSEIHQYYNEFVTANNALEAITTQLLSNITTQDNQDIISGLNVTAILESIDFVLEYFILMYSEDDINITDEEDNQLNLL